MKHREFNPPRIRWCCRSRQNSKMQAHTEDFSSSYFMVTSNTTLMVLRMDGVVLGIVVMIHRYDDSSLLVASRRLSVMGGIVANDSLGMNRAYISRLWFERIPGGEIEGLNWTEMFLLVRRVRYE